MKGYSCNICIEKNRLLKIKFEKYKLGRLYKYFSKTVFWEEWKDAKKHFLHEHRDIEIKQPLYCE